MEHALTTEPRCLYSALAADPDLSEIVGMFVDEMPERIATLLKLDETGDWDALRRVAHQLKGAAGSYGFGPITPMAARVEAGVRNGEPEERIHALVADLVDYCRRARSGLPDA